MSEEKEKNLKDARRNHLLFILGLTIMLICLPIAIYIYKMFYVGVFIGLGITVYASVVYSKNINKWPKELV